MNDFIKWLMVPDNLNMFLGLVGVLIAWFMGIAVKAGWVNAKTGQKVAEALKDGKQISEITDNLPVVVAHVEKIQAEIKGADGESNTNKKKVQRAARLFIKKFLLG